MATSATRKADTRKRVNAAATKADEPKVTTRSKGTTKATAKKVVEPEVVTATIEASTIVPMELVRGKFNKDGELGSGEPASTGGVCFSQVDGDGNRVERGIRFYLPQDADEAAGHPAEGTLLFVSN